MATFRVNQGHTIMTRENDLRGPGQTIETEEMGEAHKEMLRDGKITQVGGREVKIDKPVSRTPELSEMTVDKEGNVVARPSVKSTVVNTGPKLTGIWTLKPADINDKSLEELNAMIIERDANIPAFDDKAEAIAWLSQDLK